MISPRHLFMTGFGLGHAPFVSGTFGSAGACGIALAVWGVVYLVNGGPLGLAEQGIVNAALFGLLLLAGWGCVHWGPWAIERFSSVARKAKDPGPVVLDEFAGQWLSLLFLPMATPGMALLALIVQFNFFRIFDIIKPPPARRLEALPHGWGILFDDLMAAVYANLAGQVVLRLMAPLVM